MEYFAVSIKPAMEKFMLVSTKKNAYELRKTIENCDWNQMQILDSYLLAPLIIKLDQLSEEKSSDLKFELINCIKSIISKSRLKNINQLKTSLIILLKQIYDFNSGLLHKDLSEEIKLSVISCLSKIFQKTNNDVLEIFYAKENSNLIGKIAATCVDVLQIDKYKKLRVVAVQCLQSLFYVHNEADFEDIVLRQQVADSTFLFLPKIVAVLTEVSLSDEKVGESLVVLSIQTLGAILHLIYEDKVKDKTAEYSPKDFIELISQKNEILKEQTKDILLGSNLKNKTFEEKMKIIKDMARCEKWFEATSKKLKSIFRNLQNLHSNSNRKVRREYANFVTRLLKKCNYNLKENIDVFLESIIALSQDDDYEIQNICENTLKEIKTKHIIMIEWETLFDQHMIKLPRIITRHDDAEQISEFLFLKGFFKHIPEEPLYTIFSFKNNLERFTDNIIEALILKFTRDLLTEEYSIRLSTINELDNSRLFPWRNFINISLLNVIKLIQDTCGIIGISSVNFILFNHLIEILNKSAHLSNEIFLFLTFMLASSAVNYDKKQSCTDLFLNELSDEKHWHLVLLPDEPCVESTDRYTSWHVDRTPGLYESAYEVRITDIDSTSEFNDVSKNIVNRIDAQFNVLHTCIILDAVGNCALVMKENFKKYIFKFLHRVLLNSNNTNYLVHKAGCFALNCIKNALNYKDISKLVYDYSDYLSYHINKSLKNPELSDLGIDILAVVIQYSSLESFTYLENILNSLLEELTKSTQPKCILSYLKVINIFLINISKWIKTFKEDIKSKSTIINVDIEYEEDILTSLKSILNRPNFEINSENEKFSEKNNENEELSENIDDNVNENKENMNHPKYVSIITKILKKVLKFISSKEQMHKIVALECMISGLPELKDYEDEVLPLVHLLWYPYSERFKDSDSIVLNRCFILLEVLTDCSKTFLQKRILKDIIPFLNGFLKTSLKNSSKNKNLTSNQEHKLQIKLLNEYPKIIIDMDIQQEHLEDITNIVILYLNKNQPEILQESAVLYLIEISKYNKPLLYIKLQCYKNNLNFRDNINKVFNKINIKI